MESIVFGEDKIKIEQIVNVAHNRVTVGLSQRSEFRDKIIKSFNFLSSLLQEEGRIYGVTTGFGDSCTVEIDEDLVEQLPLQLIRFHRCGLGEYFDEVEGRAVVATRLASLCNGMSGTSFALLERLAEFLNADIVPQIPQEGSVGASGDLTPLSYLAAALVGEGTVYYRGEVREALEVLSSLNLEPLKLRPKEGLALMNGTAVMTALACLAYDRASYLAKMASKITSLACVALQGNDFHYDEVLFSAKPHPGQNEVARRIRLDLHANEAPVNSNRLQDRYSLRCAPHVIGVLEDSLPTFRQFIETELNSSNDNPIIDGEQGRVLHGGHFYGGHIAFAMDSMKNLVANVADLLDRQLALLVDPKFNNGLPPNLTGATGPKSKISHGFKAVQIGVSAWTAEALKLTMPASVFSRSTECHNQDKVSMGTIAARDALRVLQLTEQVAAALVLACTQAIELRKKKGEILESALSGNHKDFLEEALNNFQPLVEDRPLEHDLRQTTRNIQRQKWDLY